MSGKKRKRKFSFTLAHAGMTSWFVRDQRENYTKITAIMQFVKLHFLLGMFNAAVAFEVKDKGWQLLGSNVSSLDALEQWHEKRDFA